MAYGKRFSGGRRGACVLAAIGAAALACGGGGCKGSGSTAIIKDDSNVRLAEARKFAGQAQQEAKAGHTDKAIALYQKSLDQSRDLFFVWNNLGLLLMEKE